MKCECGFERLMSSVLCRMIEVKDNNFKVEIYAPDGQLMARSQKALITECALAFVRNNVDLELYTTHFHWEDAIAEHLTEPVHEDHQMALTDHPMAAVA